MQIVRFDPSRLAQIYRLPSGSAGSWPRVKVVSPTTRSACEDRSTEHLKPRPQYAEDAVQLANAGNWDEAVKLE
jgi:hypothetical protein